MCCVCCCIRLGIIFVCLRNFLMYRIVCSLCILLCGGCCFDLILL